MNKRLINELRTTIAAALVTAGQAHGVAFELGGAKYTDVSVNFSLMAIEVGEKGEDPAKVLYQQDCTVFGLRPEWFGETFRIGIKAFTICGLKPQNRKYPVLAKGSTGSVYKFEASRVRQLLGDQKPIASTSFPGHSA
jgi:hypothetical protein